MKGFIALFLVALSHNSVASECKGHVFFFKGSDPAVNSEDFNYHYSQIQNWLSENNISYSYHTSMPIEVKTCFGYRSVDEKQVSNAWFGYVLAKSNGDNKLVYGTQTDIDLQAIFSTFFK